MRCTAAEHVALREQEGLKGRMFRDLVDDEGPVCREDVYQQRNVVCGSCGAVHSFYDLVSSRVVTADYIAAEHARESAAAAARMGVL